MRIQLMSLKIGAAYILFRTKKFVEIVVVVVIIVVVVVVVIVVVVVVGVVGIVGIAVIVVVVVLTAPSRVQNRFFVSTFKNASRCFGIGVPIKCFCFDCFK